MTHNHEVISAFLDDEPFDAAELRAALDDPAARDLLIDLVALRQLTQVPTVSLQASMRSAPVHPWLRWTLAAAAALLATLGGFAAGRIVAPVSAERPMGEAPKPTRVIDASGSTWRDVNSGSGQ